MFVACEDDPSSLGLENIPDGDKIGLLEINSVDVPMEQKSSFYNASLIDSTWDPGTSTRLLVGKNLDVTSSMLIMFRSGVADSIKEYYDNNKLTIQKAWIELLPVYTLGDKSEPFSLEVSKINSAWNSSLFDKDSLEQLVRPYISDTRTISDLNDTLITFEIPNEMANDWLVGSIKDSTELNYGLLFEPTSSSNKILGFYSLHQDNVSNGFDNIPVAKIEINKTGSGLDTLLFYSSRDVHVVDGNIPSDDGTFIYLQGGFPLRANYYIDISAIPEHSIIVDAELEFHYDSTLSRIGTVKSSTINLLMYKDSTTKSLISSYRSLTRDTLENKFTGNVKQFIQSWNEDTDNQGLFVNMLDEEYTLNRLAIYGPKYSDPLLRPKLTVRYTKR